MSEAPRTSALANWALGLAVVFVIPFLPVLGALLGAVAWVRIRRSGGRLEGEGRAATAIGIGLVSGAVSLIAFYAVVVPGFLGLGPRARITNAEGNLRDIERGLYRFHAAHRRFPEGETPWTPDEPCCAGDQPTCPLEPGDWSRDPIWRALEFTPRTRPAFQLRYRSDDGRDFVVEARGDVECDGAPERLEMRGGLSRSGNPKTEPIERVDDPGLPE